MNARDAVQGVGPSAGISKRKLRANRVNKPAGTGPTSAAGKARAARNARKHGLNVPVHYDPNLCAHVEAIAAEIVPGCRDTELLGFAHRIAEAQVDLIRVARARRDIISAAMADPNYRPVNDLGRMAGPDRAACERPPPSVEKLAAILSDMCAKLASLDRYERDALSRRKRAIRAYDRACRTTRRRRRAPPSEPAPRHTPGHFYKTN
jgi:hypothetical protein